MLNAPTRPAVPIQGLFLALCFLLPTVPAAERPPEQEFPRLNPMLESNIDRPLRYFPENGDFVITNGLEYFNRPLYSANAPFRIDGGDRPEFSLYLSGRGGNLRVGLREGSKATWLNDWNNIVTRYRPGSLIHEFSNGAGNVLRLTVLPIASERGFIGRVETGPAFQKNSEFVLAFGGVNGMRGRRSGDIGCENLPVGQFFQLRPEQCRDDRISLGPSRFITRGRPGAIAGALPGATASIADASHWASLSDLLDSASHPAESISNRLVILRFEVRSGVPFHFIFQQVETNTTWDRWLVSVDQTDLARQFERAETERRAIAGQVVVETPDPFLDSAVAALNVAANGVWDERQQSFMHGAVAWRNRLLGWRGMYSGDALGRHDRTRLHFEGFARQQNTNPIPAELPPADASANLSRSEAALHSNGNMTRNHYDMNLVAVDAFFRHLLWTGDLEFARRMWPAIERHFAWERRLFRREFGPDKLPLYEGYAAIWASDDLAYNGGGAAHSSAYNHFHNRMAGRVAKLLGKDAAPYEREADLIAQAMRKHLWLADRGWFAEWKDLLGEQLTHPNAAVWTFYHTLDSQVPTEDEAWQMCRFIDRQIVRIPIRGPGVPPGNFTIPTTSWMPYTWSLNNVAMAEAMHTALACWQAGRADAALPLFKGAVLDSMFLGLCPGNVGLTTFYDAYRRETQRDFADAVGATSRALVEGLFGVRPDALAGELRIRPGFPASWKHARIRHPDFRYEVRRDAGRERYAVQSTFAKPMRVRLEIPARPGGLKSVVSNGNPVQWRKVEPANGPHWIEIETDTNRAQVILVEWAGGDGDPVGAERGGISPDQDLRFESANRSRQREAADASSSSNPPPHGGGYDWGRKPPPGTRFDLVDLTPHFNDRVTQIFRNEYLAPRSPHCSLATPKQGIGSWCHPNDSFDVDDTGLRKVARENSDRILLPNQVPLATPGALNAPNILFTSQWTNYPKAATIPLDGRASHLFLLMAGSTSAMQSRCDNGEAIVTYADGSNDRLPLHNPINWWPIDQDYFIDDFAFRRPEPIPPRVDLKTGAVRLLDPESFKGKGGRVPGGAATVLELPLDSSKELKHLSIHAMANEVVIGLMAVTLQR